MFVDLGEYQAGENAENDRAMDLRDPISAWLRQRNDEHASLDNILQEMRYFAS